VFLPSFLPAVPARNSPEAISRVSLWIEDLKTPMGAARGKRIKAGLPFCCTILFVASRGGARLYYEIQIIADWQGIPLLGPFIKRNVVASDNFPAFSYAISRLTPCSDKAAEAMA